MPNLTNYTEPNPGTGCGDDSDHMERVASVMKSTHSLYQGVAPDASLYAAGKCTSSMSDLESQNTNAKNWGALAVNNSWAVSTAVGAKPSNDDKFFDSLVFNNLLTIGVAAGNSTDGTGNPVCALGAGVYTNGMVTSPSLGFNVITVGGTSNVVSGAYPDIWGCSAWKNPGSTNSDRNKPEVVAPADGVDAMMTCGQSTYFDYTTCDAYGTISGTSLATPFITATSALLLQAAPVLSSWPETIKAAIMAASQPLPNSDTDHYGAGLTNIGAAVDLINGVNGNWRANSALTCSGNWPFAWAAYLYGGRQTRVAITWSQDPNYNNYANQPQADLDLYVVDQSNRVVALSESYDNNYEFVDFVPAQDGTYMIQFQKYRCDYTFANNRLGIAWHQAP